jgi:hypothetical protein
VSFRFRVALILLLLPLPCYAQAPFSSRAWQEFSNALTQAGRFGAPRYATAALPACTTANTGAIAWDTTALTLKTCNGSSYTAIGALASGTTSVTGCQNRVLYGNNSNVLECEAALGYDTSVDTFTVSTILINATSTLTNNIPFYLGASTIGGFVPATALTPDNPALLVGTTGEALHVYERDDWFAGFDFQNGPCGTTACTDPELIVHSHNQDTTNYTALGAWGLAGSMRKTLTESSATAIVQVPIAASAGTGGTLNYCVFAADATDQQERCASIRFAITNKAATETCGMNPTTVNETTDNNAASISTGTLTYAVTCDTSPSNAVNFAINAVSSLTQTTLEARYSILLTGPQQPLPQ